VENCLDSDCGPCFVWVFWVFGGAGLGYFFGVFRIVRWLFGVVMSACGCLVLFVRVLGLNGGLDVGDVDVVVVDGVGVVALDEMV